MPLPSRAKAIDIQNEIELIVSKEEYRLQENEAESVLEGIGSLAQEIVAFAQNFLAELSNTNPIVFYIVLISATLSLLYLAWWNIQQLKVSALRRVRKKTEQQNDSTMHNALRKKINQELEQAIREDNFLDIVRALFRLYVVGHEDALRKKGVAIGSLDSLTVREVLRTLPKEKANELERTQILKILETSFYDDRVLSKEDVNIVSLALQNERVI